MKKRKPFNAGNPKHVAQQEEAAKAIVDQRLKDFKKILDMPEGIRIFAWIMEEGKMFSTSFTGNSTTFFNEGMRNLTLKIFGTLCEAAPDKVYKLIIKPKENRDDR